MNGGRRRRAERRTRAHRRLFDDGVGGDGRSIRGQRHPRNPLAAVELGAGQVQAGDRHGDVDRRQQDDADAGLQRRRDSGRPHRRARGHPGTDGFHRWADDRQVRVGGELRQGRIDQIAQQRVDAVVRGQVGLVEHPRIELAAQQVCEQLTAFLVEHLRVAQVAAPVRVVVAVVLGDPVGRRGDVEEEVVGAPRDDEDARLAGGPHADVGRRIVLTRLGRVAEEVSQPVVERRLQERRIAEAGHVRLDQRVTRIVGKPQRVGSSVVLLNLGSRGGRRDFVEVGVVVGVADPEELRLQRLRDRGQRVGRRSGRRAANDERVALAHHLTRKMPLSMSVQSPAFVHYAPSREFVSRQSDMLLEECARFDLDQGERPWEKGRPTAEFSALGPDVDWDTLADALVRLDCAAWPKDLADYVSRLCRRKDIKALARRTRLDPKAVVVLLLAMSDAKASRGAARAARVLSRGLSKTALAAVEARARQMALS